MLTRTTTTSRPPADTIAVLQSRVKGQVITPQDPEYEEARLAWNRTVDQHPALIVFAACAADVAEAVQYARRQGLGIAVQSTGHGITLPADGALLVVTAQLQELRIDPEGQTAYIGAGLQWGQVLDATQEYGLAPLLGTSPNVGVVGYTLGGGVGWLARKYGLAADSVLSFDLVDAEGRRLCASIDQNADLFWGLRGGGGSFGVITGMEIRLYPVDMVYGGNLYYSADLAREVLQRYREWIRTAPEALTSSVVLMNYPPIPQLPEAVRGKSFVIIRGCYVGSLEKGAELLQSWREWKTPLIDDFKPMPFRQVAKISSDPVKPSAGHITGGWMHALSDAAIDTLIEYALPSNGPCAITMAEVRHLGGATARTVVPAAFSHRDAELLLFVSGMAPSPEAAARLDACTSQMKQALGPALTGGVYLNFVHGSEAHERTQDGYAPAALRGLRQLKARLDPENVFRYSYDIAPQK